MSRDSIEIDNEIQNHIFYKLYFVIEQSFRIREYDQLRTQRFLRMDQVTNQVTLFRIYHERNRNKTIHQINLKMNIRKAQIPPGTSIRLSHMNIRQKVVLLLPMQVFRCECCDKRVSHQNQHAAKHACRCYSAC